MFSFVRLKTQKAIKRDVHFGLAANPADAHDFFLFFSLSLSLYIYIWAMEWVSFLIVFRIFKRGKGTPHKKALRVSLLLV